MPRTYIIADEVLCKFCLAQAIQAIELSSKHPQLIQLGYEFLVEEINYLLGRFGLDTMSYIESERIGRGSNPNIDNQTKRLIAEELVPAYQLALQESNYIDWNYLREQVFSFMQAGIEYEKYDILVVDEAQDLSALQIKILLNLTSSDTNSITLIRDTTQRIYKNNYIWDDINLTFGIGSKLDLQKNYRNTHEIAMVAASLMQSTLIEEHDIDILNPDLTETSGSASLYIDIWRNSIITHGHPRGLIGALLLADSIKLLIENPQNQLEWLDSLIEKCSNYSQLEKIWNQDNLFLSWKNKWQSVCNHNFTFAWNDICQETIEYLVIVKREYNTGDLDKILTRIGCFERQTKGAGNITVVASILFLCRFSDFQNGSSNFGNVITPIVNKIGIDTDTIAYFAGAMLGVKYGLQSIPELFKQKIQDYNYLLKVADYCYGLYSKNKNLESIFIYPEKKNINLSKISTLLQNPDANSTYIDIPIFGNAKILQDDDITPTWQEKHLHFVKLELEFGQTIYCKVERDLSHVSRKVEEIHTKGQSLINSLPALDEFKNHVENSNFNSEVVLDILRELKFKRKDKAIYNAFTTWLWASLPNKN
ncbi:MAG: ADP-ribosylglycohydrolase family protein [Nostoc sp. CreGUA01]